MEPTILVKPNGSQGPYNASMYTNSVLNGNVEDWIIKDLIPYVDANYNTRNEKQFRTIMGHSMGTDGASRLALTYPELFRARPHLWKDTHVLLPMIQACWTTSGDAEARSYLVQTFGNHLD